MNADWVVVRTFPTHIEADLASSALAAAGIDASIRADDCGGVYPFKGGIELLVAQEDAALATEVLDTSRIGHFNSRGLMALVTLEAIRAAATRIAGDVRRTPILDLSDLAGRSLLLKCEHHQPGGAFKIRGASHMLAGLSPEALAKGVVTYSSGNHGQAVALAAHRRGVRAVIVMPTTAPTIKIEGVKRWGGEVILEGTTSADRLKRAKHEVETRGLTMVPPFDHEEVIIGQGTCALEILEQVPDAGTVVVPVGGGGLLSGVAAALKQARPEVVVVGVEPAGAPKMSRSLAAGHPITLDSVSSLADGLMPVRPGDITFAHAQAYVDHVITIDDAAIARGAMWLFFEAKQVVEPSGAATTAAVLWPAPGSPLVAPKEPVVAIVSGGNVSPATIVSLSQVATGS